MQSWAVVNWLGHIFTPCSHCQQQTKYEVAITWQTDRDMHKHTQITLKYALDGRGLVWVNIKTKSIENTNTAATSTKTNLIRRLDILDSIKINLISYIEFS